MKEKRPSLGARGPCVWQRQAAISRYVGGGINDGVGDRGFAEERKITPRIKYKLGGAFEMPHVRYGGQREITNKKSTTRRGGGFSRLK